MGILPVQLPADAFSGAKKLEAGDRIHVLAEAPALKPRMPIAIRLLRRDGKVDLLEAVAAVETLLEAELLRRGGVMPSILHNTIEASSKKPVQ
jgi:aconitate hydratase